MFPATYSIGKWNQLRSLRSVICRTDGISSDKSWSLYSPTRFDSYHGAYESHKDSELFHSISYFVLLFATFVVERVFRFMLGFTALRTFVFQTCFSLFTCGAAVWSARSSALWR